MALIDHLAVDANEREIARARTQNMLNVYGKKLFTRDNLNKIFGEWEDVARRLRVGEGLIADAYTTWNGTSAKSAHFISLSHLYELLVAMCRIYDAFFCSVFPPEGDGDKQYQKVHDRIMEILLAA